MTSQMVRLTFVCSLVLSASALANQETPTAEQTCQQQLTRFIGMQNHVNQLGDNQVPQMSVGLSAAQIEQITQQQGYCQAWQQLVESLQQQHAEVLDKTEQKTGLPSPKR